ncbi:RHS repeat protein [Massilia sp. Dwa41.01b]|uniref:DUF6531 domain-containing protein n=1 Tax=unclassified Massilia TaxID=2609279 RepID=UPI0016047439|nr:MULTISPECIES: DUF6531 domain-containing protein [unclassified Massilia]QNA87721.1 RHS repeat protein [Massilia sp. Dwa41.01b]QNA98620.1 RHS repeat protein [Massilia sp. Se16.2.3]
MTIGLFLFLCANVKITCFVNSENKMKNYSPYGKNYTIYLKQLFFPAGKSRAFSWPICLCGIFIMFCFGEGSAWAQLPSQPPEVKPRYAFFEPGRNELVWTEVGSHAEACIGSMNAHNALAAPDPGYSNPRVVPWHATGEIDSDYVAQEQLDCLWWYSVQSVDIPATAGWAICGGDFSYPFSSKGLVLNIATIKCECQPPARWFADVQQCIEVQKVVPTNVGPPDCDVCNSKDGPQFGEPIDPATGNMWHVETDFAAVAPGGLEVKRTYNSSPLSEETRGMHSFGANWVFRYDAMLRHEQPPPTSEDAWGKQCWQRMDTEFIWCEPFLYTKFTNNPSAISILRGNGKRSYFKLINSEWVSGAATNDRIAPLYDSTSKAIVGWSYTAAPGDFTERYDAGGKLISISSRAGARQSLTYSSGDTNNTAISRWPADAPVCSHVQDGETLPSGRLLCVTDQWGQQIQFEHDPAGRITKVIDPNGKSYLYEYDGVSGGCLGPGFGGASCSANNLTKVTFPDEKSRTYFYHESAKINSGQSCSSGDFSGAGDVSLNALTGLIDENGQRYITWEYDCMGRATSSYLGNGVDKVRITYSSNMGRTVTEYIGSPDAPSTVTSTLTYKRVLDDVKNSKLSGSCVGCGLFKSRLYDANGNVSQTEDWNGGKTSYQYNLTRNLEKVRIEAYGTTAPRTISTEWHPKFRLPVRIAEPKRITINTYDNQGNLLSRRQEATDDSDGSKKFSAVLLGKFRVWNYTYNTAGRIATATDPNKYTTIYDYDQKGNLEKITNALAQITTLSNYDANGRVGRIIEPNKVTTDLTYHPRGWLETKTVEAGGVKHVTRYEYDGVGQLKAVVNPDESYIRYEYDDAHRLTDVTDSRGNKIHYTLDLKGNRIKEEVSDAEGLVIRKISRQYDKMNRLQQVTGGTQ